MTRLLADKMSSASRLKISSSLAAQMNHNINMLTIAQPLTTDTSMTVVVDLNALYSRAIEK
jgi:hypothetical protein